MNTGLLCPHCEKATVETAREYWFLYGFVLACRYGTKVVVGDGPQRRDLESRFPDVVFVGEQHGEALARHFAAADIFVFPSRTDTFGLVLLEALACGVPVAAYPVPGPLDVVGINGPGCLDEDLALAVTHAVERGAPEACRTHALGYSWENCVDLFVSHLARIGEKPEQVTAE